MTNPNYSLTLRAMQVALGDNDNGALEYAIEYGEPGYTQTEKGVLLANWNRVDDEINLRLNTRGMTNKEQRKNVARKRAQALCDRLEAQGYALEWSDQWLVDWDHGGKAYRTTADSHGWEPRVRACDGFDLTPDSDAEEWIADSLNEEDKPLPSWFNDADLERLGFALWEQEDKEVGFHPGQNETPDKFCPALRDEDYDFVLQVTGRGQFDVHYRVWTRRETSEGEPGAQFCEFMDTYYNHK